MDNKEKFRMSLSAFVQISEGRMTFGDPAYMPTEIERSFPNTNSLVNDLMPGIDVPPGQYPVYTIHLDKVPFGLMVLNTSVPIFEMGLAEFIAVVDASVCEFEIGVDSGTICFASEECRMVWRDADRTDLMHMDLKQKIGYSRHSQIAQFNIGELYFPVVSLAAFSTTFGDGTFPVFVARDDAENLLAITIQTGLKMRELKNE